MDVFTSVGVREQLFGLIFFYYVSSKDPLSSGYQGRQQMSLPTKPHLAQTKNMFRKEANRKQLLVQKLVEKRVRSEIKQLTLIGKKKLYSKS